MLTEHRRLPLKEQYIRCVEEHSIPGEGSFSLVICMFRGMSELLITTKRPSIDTSFKRLDKWQEFEIEAWFPEFFRCEYMSYIPLISIHKTCSNCCCSSIYYISICSCAPHTLHENIRHCKGGYWLPCRVPTHPWPRIRHLHGGRTPWPRARYVTVACE